MVVFLHLMNIICHVLHCPSLYFPVAPTEMQLAIYHEQRANVHLRYIQTILKPLGIFHCTSSKYIKLETVHLLRSIGKSSQLTSHTLPTLFEHRENMQRRQGHLSNHAHRLSTRISLRSAAPQA